MAQLNHTSLSENNSVDHPSANAKFPIQAVLETVIARQTDVMAGLAVSRTDDDLESERIVADSLDLDRRYAFSVVGCSGVQFVCRPPLKRSTILY
jgi:hypothetical protein